MKNFQKNYKKFMAIFITAIMSLSIIGFIGAGSIEATNTKAQNLEYNGYTFTQEGSLWTIELNGIKYYFQNPPSTLEIYGLPSVTENILSNQKIYAAYNPNDVMDITNTLYFLRSFFIIQNKQSFEACIVEEGCDDIPIIDCETDFAVILEVSEETKINSNGNCLLLKAPNELTRNQLAERLAYKALNIMP